MQTPPKATFKTTTHGKWILTGEHAVLRGHPAIISLVREKALTLEYQKSDAEIRADFNGDYGDELQFLFWGAIERAIEILDLHHADIHGHFKLSNNIPVGAGMGASAALCVAIGRWFVAQAYFPKENLLEFCRQLENLFHNESSGADIAAVIAEKCIFFSRSGGLHAIKLKWSPRWYLFHSDAVAITSRCVKKVKELWAKDPKFGQRIDDDMAKSVQLAEKALQTDKKNGLPQLVEAIKLGHQCFQRWELAQGNVARHIKTLLTAGALAAKPTGSGNGGFIVSLWDKKPPKELEPLLIAV